MPTDEIGQRFVDLREQYDAADPAERANLEPQLKELMDQIEDERQADPIAEAQASEAQVAQAEGEIAQAAERGWFPEVVNATKELVEIAQAYASGVTQVLSDTGKVVQIIGALHDPQNLPEYTQYVDPPAQVEQASMPGHSQDHAPGDANDVALDFVGEQMQKEKWERMEDAKEQRGPLYEENPHEGHPHEEHPGRDTPEQGGRDAEGEKLINEFQQHVEQGCMLENLKEALVQESERMFHQFERMEHIPQAIVFAFEQAAHEGNLDHVKEIVGQQVETHYGAQHREAFEHAYQEHASQVQHQVQHHEQAQQHTQQQTQQSGHSAGHPQ